MKKVVLASNNAGKLAEFARLLQPLNIEVLPQNSFDIPDCDEPFHTFVENALHKARHAARLTGLPALADDSGLCVPALGGAPGVYSARYAGNRNDASNNAKLLNALEGSANRRAYFYCVLVWVRHVDDPQPLIVDGLWWGEILEQAKGEGGFGYDPLFYIKRLNLTASEMDYAQKNALSHRGQAVQKLLNQINEII